MDARSNLNAKIDQMINKDMEIITQEIRKIVNPVSIFLIGSFGRGEGSVVLINNKLSPIKDYDILVVVDKKVSKSELELISIKSELALGYKVQGNHVFSDFEVSILPITIDKLKNLVDIKGYEIKTASKLIYGIDVRQRIKFSKREIPLASGSRLLFRKAVGLLRRFSADFLHSSPSYQERMALI